METIQYLKNQTYLNFDIIIIDQTESIPTYFTNFINEFNFFNIIFKKIRIKGLPNARNEGMGIAKGNIILFLDDDINPGNDLIYEHLKTHRLPNVCAVSGPVIEEGVNISWITKFRKVGTINIFCRPNKNRYSQKELFVETNFGGNMSFKKKDIISNNIQFDVNFIGTSLFEESDFSYRIRKLTKKNIIYNPKASLIHLPQEDGNLGQKMNNHVEFYYSMFHNMILFSLKNQPRWKLLFSIPFHCLIAIKRGVIVEKDYGSFKKILSGLIDGYKTYLSTLG